jgi:ABC-type proline/glycine betaine transport system permease subunit
MEILFKTIGWYVLNGAVFLASVAAICYMLLLLCSLICTEVFDTRREGPMNITAVIGVVASCIFCYHMIAKYGLWTTILCTLGVVVVIAASILVLMIGVALEGWWHHRKDIPVFDFDY